MPLMVSTETELEANHPAIAASSVQLPQGQGPSEELRHQATGYSIRSSSVARRKNTPCAADAFDVKRATIASENSRPSLLWARAPTAQALNTLNSTRSLVAPTRVEADLLRAVRLSTVLQRCGAAFGSQECVAENYQKSFETDHINVFVSHDWASGRLSKMMALCLVYNSRAAMSASTIAGVTLGLLQYGPDPILPVMKPNSTYQAEDDANSTKAKFYGQWCTFCGPIVFWVFFLFWQEIRFVLRLGVRSCFLDRYCIDQSNPERKAAGILGLAGFLRCSDSIIILWTPRYFTRLWCTYEVASWLHLQKPLASVNFMPLALAQIVVTMSVASTTTSLLLAVFHPYFPQLYVQILIATFFIGFWLIAHQMRHCVGHLRAIPEQLANFSVTSSQCLCCTVEHYHNGEEIPCDREVVYTTIAEWFKDDGGHVNQEAALERFDRAVRMRFAAQVLQKASPTSFALRHSVVGGVAYIFRACDAIPAIHHLGRNWFVSALIAYVTVVATLPVLYKASMKVACLMDSRVGIPRSKVLDLLLSMSLGSGITLYALVAQGGFVAMSTTTTTAVWPTVLVALGFCLLCVLTHYEDLKPWLPRRWPPRRGAERTASTGLGEQQHETLSETFAALPAQITEGEEKLEAPSKTVADLSAQISEGEEKLEAPSKTVADLSAKVVSGWDSLQDASSTWSTDVGVLSESPLRIRL